MSAKAFAVIMKPLIDLYGEPKNWAVNRDVYFEALRDVPQHWLVVAVRQHIRDPDQGRFFPKPAELRAQIMHELAEHRREAQEAYRRAYALPPPPSAPEPSAEDKAHVSRIVAQMNASMAEKAVSIKTGKPLPPVPEGEAAYLSALLAKRMGREVEAAE